MPLLAPPLLLTPAVLSPTQPAECRLQPSLPPAPPLLVPHHVLSVLLLLLLFLLSVLPLLWLSTLWLLPQASCFRPRCAARRQAAAALAAASTAHGAPPWGACAAAALGACAWLSGGGAQSWFCSHRCASRRRCIHICAPSVCIAACAPRSAVQPPHRHEVAISLHAYSSSSCCFCCCKHMLMPATSPKQSIHAPHIGAPSGIPDQLQWTVSRRQRSR